MPTLRTIGTRKAECAIRKLERSIVFGYVFGLPEVSKTLGFALRILPTTSFGIRTGYFRRNGFGISALPNLQELSHSLFVRLIVWVSLYVFLPTYIVQYSGIAVGSVFELSATQPTESYEIRATTTATGPCCQTHSASNPAARAASSSSSSGKYVSSSAHCVKYSRARGSSIPRATI